MTLLTSVRRVSMSGDSAGDGDRLGHARRAHLDIGGQCLADRHLEISKGRA